MPTGKPFFPLPNAPKDIRDAVNHLMNSVNALLGRVDKVDKAGYVTASEVVRDYGAKAQTVELSARGTAPLNVQGLIGRLAQPQYPYVPTYSSAPSVHDPVSQNGAVVSIGEVLYRFDGSNSPGSWKPQGAVGVVLQGTWSALGSTAASGYPVGSLYYVTDRAVVYVVKVVGGANAWVYLTGVQMGAVASAPTLGTNDVGYQYLATDVNVLLVWDGAAWEAVNGYDPASGTFMPVYDQTWVLRAKLTKDGLVFYNTDGVTELCKVLATGAGVRVWATTAFGGMVIEGGQYPSIKLVPSTGATKTGQIFQDGDSLHIATDGVGERVTILLGNGYMGVNDVSPSYQLDVNGDVNTTGVYRVSGTQIAASNLSNTTTGSGKVVLDTSPTIVTPTIASFTNANHGHTDSAGGGTLAASAIGSGTLAMARVGKRTRSIAVKTADYTIQTGDDIIIGKGAITITLPQGSTVAGEEFTFVKGDATGTTVVACYGSEVLYTGSGTQNFTVKGSGFMVTWSTAESMWIAV